MHGVERLVAAGFLPIITCMQSWPEGEADGVLEGFRALLAGIGYARARLKMLPPLLIGAEAERTHGYLPEERVTHEMLQGFDLDQLLCTRARLVTRPWRATLAPSSSTIPPPVWARPSPRPRAARAPRRAGLLHLLRSGSICSNAPAAGRDLS